MTQQRKDFEDWAKENLKNPLLKWSDTYNCYLGIETAAAWKAWVYMSKKLGAYQS